MINLRTNSTLAKLVIEAQKEKGKGSMKTIKKQTWQRWSKNFKN